MSMDHLDRCFTKFRRLGSSKDLATVFDATAAELLRVATHLAADRAAAEDLLQSTFLTAIERAETYDGARPVRKWLLGILHNHARNLRRRARPVAADSNGAPVFVDGSVEARELARQIRTSIAAVPQPYREVVELRLVEDLSTEAIALRLGRPAGTVRTQCHRGMSFLRRALPSGATLLAIAGSVPARGLAAIRSEVLATTGAGSVVTATAAAAASVNALRALVVAVLLLGTGYVLWPDVTNTPAPLPTGGGVDAAQHVDEVEEVASRTKPDDTKATQPTRKVVVPVGDGEKPKDPSAIPKDQLILEVVDARGRPVPHARVEFELTEQASNIGVRHFGGARKCDEHGRLIENVNEFIGTVLAYRDDIGSSGGITMDHTKKGTGKPWRLVLHPGVPLSGVVQSADGAPVAGAGVKGYAQDAGRTVNAKTDAFGRFALTVDRDTLYVFHARKDSAESDRYVVESGALTAGSPPLEMRMRGAHILHVEVVKPDGTAAPGTQIRILKLGGHPRHPHRWRFRTESNGGYEVLLSRPGRYQVIAMHSEFAHSSPVVAVIAPEQRSVRTRIQLTGWSTLRGRVELDDGRPLGGVRITGSGKGARTTETRSRADGAFELTKVNPQVEYVIEAFLSDKQREALGIAKMPEGGLNLIMCSDGRQRVARVTGVKPGTNDVRVEVELAALRTGTLIGSIVDAATGKPIADRFDGRIVEFHKDRAGDKNFWADQRGADRFTVTGIPVGITVMLEFNVKGYARQWFGPWRVEAVQRELKIEMHPPATVKCTVSLGRGAAVGAKVTAQPSVLRPVRNPPRPAVTGIDGSCELKLAPGKYRLRAVSGSHVGAQDIEVVAGANRPIEIVLTRK